MKALIHQSEKDNQWYAEFRSDNHETWFVSEGYTSEVSAFRSVEDFYARFGATSRLDIKVVDKNGLVYTEVTFGGDDEGDA